MRIFEGLSQLPSRGWPPTALTIGNFDGVHRGHRSMIKKLNTHALAAVAVQTVVTFDPHPQEVLHGQAPPRLITSDRKLELLAEAGIQQVVVLKFDRSLSQMEPEAFIEQILVERLGAKVVVVGANFRFGRFARGDVTMLRSAGRTHKFVFESVRLAELDGRRLSSTEVRHAIEAGDLGWANSALGRPHSIPGRVVRGKGRGASLGFPTANVEPLSDLCLPALGIYAGRFKSSDEVWPAAVSVGTNPTFGSNPTTIEAYLLDFEGDLYGREVEIEFLERLRGEQPFPDAQALSAAIEQDVARVRNIF